MAINKKLIHFKSKENFEKEVANENILDTSICFILDSKEISTHGTVYKTVNWSILEEKKEKDYSKEYFTFVNTSRNPLSVQLKLISTVQTLNYKLSNSEDWLTSTALTIGVGEEVQLKGSYGQNSEMGIGTFSVNDGTFDIKGNIMSLLYGDNFERQTVLTDKRMMFNSLFQDCTTLVNANELILPTTNLRTNCYFDMFRGCTSLTTAPELPATTLAESCYAGMFEDCTSLTEAPELPATKLNVYCYSGMFKNCTSLTTAPELPATAVTEYEYGCYLNMFAGCTSLTSTPVLPITTLTYGCYLNMFEGCNKLSNIIMLATNISAGDCLTNWVSGVATTGTFVKHPNMTSLPNGINGIPEGWTVEDYKE